MSPLRRRTVSAAILAITALAVAVPAALVSAANAPRTAQAATQAALVTPERAGPLLRSAPPGMATTSHSAPLHIVHDGRARIAGAPAFQTSSNWAGYVAG